MLVTDCTYLSEAKNPYLPRAALESEEANGLVIPGAEVLRRVGREREDTIEGPKPSFVGAVYGVQVSEEDVLAFYRRELERLQWSWEGRSSISSGELRAWSWCKPQMRFRLAVFDPERYARTGIEGGERFKTVFDARIRATITAGVLACRSSQ